MRVGEWWDFGEIKRQRAAEERARREREQAARAAARERVSTLEGLRDEVMGFSSYLSWGELLRAIVRHLLEIDRRLRALEKGRGQ